MGFSAQNENLPPIGGCKCLDGVGLGWAEREECKSALLVVRDLCICTFNPETIFSKIEFDDNSRKEGDQ